MKYIVAASAIGAAAATAANAGAIDRSGQTLNIIFEPGNYAELSYGIVKPDVSGDQLLPLGPFGAVGANSGDMAGDYDTFGFGVKVAINDKVDMALFLDEPIGASVNYAAGTGYAYSGSTATLDNTALNLVMRYKIDNNFSIVGGVRSSSLSGEVALFNGYTLDASQDVRYGYMLGAAYERPEIGLRVALTYNSAIDHTLASTEVGVFPDDLEVTIPQSINLDAQTGIAEDTLLFGSIRWVDWTEFEIAPTFYVANFGGPLVFYEDDVITYTLGVGRRFSDNWSGSFSLGYEAQNDNLTGNLGPTDGVKFAAIGLKYTIEQVEISGGIRYFMLGDAQTRAPAPYPDGTPFGDFTDNDGYAVGLKVAYRF